MPATVKITLPWFSKDLHAHAKGSRFAKTRATKTARGLAFAHATRAVIDGAPHLEGNVSILYRFFVPNNIQRDSANMVQSCKPYIDGIVDAGVISGDHWQVLRLDGVEVEIDKVNPRVELIFTQGNSK